MKKIFGIVLSFFCLLGAYAEKNIPRVEVTMPFHKGVNFSNWLEPWHGLSASMSLIGKQDFEDVKSIGADIVRVPVHFEEYSSGAPDYIVSDRIWKILDDAVAWCTEIKLYMIIDLHNNCDGSSQTKADVEKMLSKIWTQIANRYKDSSEYVLYEIHNEPHLKSGNLKADIAKWNKIQGNILKLIRKIDSKHTVIVGAENWNSITALLQLPDYNDENIIYNFHDYSPFFFTHQGASWTDLKNVTNIPFPYSKEKMPPLPKNESSWVKHSYDNYERDSSEEVMCKPLNDAVNFANKRKVALMCNEYGVQMTHPDKQERINWYKLKAKWMDERNIIRVSWDYKASFGIFNTESLTQQFPQDVNVGLIEAMGYKLPQDIKPRSSDWSKSSFNDGAYELFKNKIAKNLLVESYFSGGINAATFDNVCNDEVYISVLEAKPYNSFRFAFHKPVDFSPLVDEGRSLVFEIKTTQKNFKIDVYFTDEEDLSKGLEGQEWRSKITLTSKDGVSDGQWHKVSFPLDRFEDYGAWNNSEGKWYGSEGLFKWSKVARLVFDFADNGQTQEVCFKNIVIK